MPNYYNQDDLEMDVIQTQTYETKLSYLSAWAFDWLFYFKNVVWCVIDYATSTIDNDQPPEYPAKLSQTYMALDPTESLPQYSYQGWSYVPDWYPKVDQENSLTVDLDVDNFLLTINGQSINLSKTTKFIECRLESTCPIFCKKFPNGILVDEILHPYSSYYSKAGSSNEDSKNANVKVNANNSRHLKPKLYEILPLLVYGKGVHLHDPKSFYVQGVEEHTCSVHVVNWNDIYLIVADGL